MCLAWYALLFEEVFTPPGEVAAILGSINFCGKRIGANNVRLSDDFQYYLYITQTHCTASTSPNSHSDITSPENKVVDFVDVCSIEKGYLVTSQYFI